MDRAAAATPWGYLAFNVSVGGGGEEEVVVFGRSGRNNHPPAAPVGLPMHTKNINLNELPNPNILIRNPKKNPLVNASKHIVIAFDISISK